MEAVAKDCIIVIMVFCVTCVMTIRAPYALFCFFVLSIGLVGNRLEDWKKVRDLNPKWRTILPIWGTDLLRKYKFKVPTMGLFTYLPTLNNF